MDLISSFFAEDSSSSGGGGGLSSTSSQTANVIGSPYNVQHKLHVDFEFIWHGQVQMFEILEKLGEGGYGAVYRARHKETGFTLAIKMIDLMTDDESDKKIQDEINILRKCKHANIVSYYGCLVNEAKLWILMDYCSLGSISDVLSDCHSLSEAEISHIVAEVLKGLSYLHGLKIIHRDVKAANILITNQAQVRIADFGISAQIDKSEKLDEPVGSPFWMAPEVIMETEQTVKCDIWSLGITVLEMAEGQPPHSRNNVNPFRALFLIPKKPPPTFADPTKWSQDIQDFVGLCLQKMPHERPSATELREHPFIKRGVGPEVLRSTIISYLKAKKEKQTRLKRATAKLAQPINSAAINSAAFPSAAAAAAAAAAAPATSESSGGMYQNGGSNSSDSSDPLSSSPPPAQASGGSGSRPRSGIIADGDGAGGSGGGSTFGGADLGEYREFPSYAASPPPRRSNRASALASAITASLLGNASAAPTAASSASAAASDSLDFQTMFIRRSPEPAIPSNSSSNDEASPLKNSTSVEIGSLQKLVIDTKIEICRVREEVSNQNAILKNELNDIKTKLVELTTILVRSGQLPVPSIPLPAPPTPPSIVRKKSGGESAFRK